MIRRDPVDRAKIAELKKAIRRIEEPHKKAQRQALKAARVATRLKPDPNAGAGGFMAWQHAERIPCVACLIEGPPGPALLQGEPNPIEIAHQRRNSSAAGWQSNRLGKRVSDAQSCPLCRWHHQLAPNACDKAQGKFWDRLGVDVVAYARALFAAFKAQSPGAPLAAEFAQKPRQEKQP